MKHYEVMTIYDIDLSEEEAAELSKEVQELITSLGGKVVDTKFWGRRKFAYEVNHKKEGYYDVIKFDLAGSSVDELKKKLNLRGKIVRYLVSILEI